jgi:hypothetical protein
VAGAGLVVGDAVKPAIAFAGEAAPSLTPYLSGMRTAATRASAYRAYRSKTVSNSGLGLSTALRFARKPGNETHALLPGLERKVHLLSDHLSVCLITDRTT